MTQSTEDNKLINNTLNLNINTDDNISKQLLIEYLIRKLEDNPIDDYNELTRTWSKAYRKAISELLALLKD